MTAVDSRLRRQCQRQVNADRCLFVAAVYLNRAERRAYMMALREAKRQWDTGMFSIGNMRLQALALLQPMRRICSGGR